MMETEQVKDKYKDRAGLVFICVNPIYEESKKKFEEVMLKTGIIDNPFETIETIDNVTFFVCAEKDACYSAGLLQMINSHMQLNFMNGSMFRVDALQAFLKEL